jgi:hypothetical protein
VPGEQLTGGSIPIGESHKLPGHPDDPEFIDTVASKKIWGQEIVTKYLFFPAFVGLFSEELPQG